MSDNPHFRGGHSFSGEEWICWRCGRDWQDMRKEELDNCRGYRPTPRITNELLKDELARQQRISGE